MFWNQFENDREALRTLYSAPVWDEASGPAPADLQATLLQIEKDFEDKGRMVTKSKMVCEVLRTAQIAIDPRDFFPDRINHDDIIGRIRGRWIRQTRKTELFDLLTACADEQRGLCYTGDCDFGHTSPDWDAVMTLGLPGLRDRIRAAAAKNRDAEAQTFYACADETLYARWTCTLPPGGGAVTARLSGTTLEYEVALADDTAADLILAAYDGTGRMTFSRMLPGIASGTGSEEVPEGCRCQAFLVKSGSFAPVCAPWSSKEGSEY